MEQENRCQLLEKLLQDARQELDKKEKRLKTLKGKIVMKNKTIRDFIRKLRETVQEPMEGQGQGGRSVEEREQNLGGVLAAQPECRFFSVAKIGEEGEIPMVTLAWCEDEKKLKSLGSKLSRACFSLIANVNYGSSGGSKEKRKRG